MLRFLNISNLAVIDTLQVEFKSGLNVLSGETGSGKSIIIDALGLLLGDKASAEMIRTGSDKAFVEGIFEISGNTPLIELLAETGIEIDEDDLVIRRELGASGRGRIFINGRTANINQLKLVQPHLIDLHGQGDQQSLLSSESHLSLLDAFAGASPKRQKTSQIYDGLLKSVKELEEARQSESERLQALDIIDYQLSELDQANLRINEDIELENERGLLANAERLATLSDEAYQSLYDDEASVLARLASVQKRLVDLAEVDARFAPYLDQLLAAKHALDDTASFLRDYAETVNASPERLKEVEERLAELDRLKRKYGKSIDEAVATRERLIERRESLQRSEENAKKLEQQIRLLHRDFQKEAGDLSHLRQSAGRKFERALGKELNDVALGAARFSIQFSAPTANQLNEKAMALMGFDLGAIRRSGKESVEFHFSANPGEDLRPMQRVASGGELSRLMLVLKTITAPSLFPRTLIFDEIDAGIGGKVADAVGQRLKRLAETNQVLCVTHQSQIARYADAHFQVSKEVVKGRTITKVMELDNEGRVEELARMIGGMEVTTSARKHAKELLKTN